VKRNGDHPDQFAFSFAPTITPRGDGSFIVVPGKPIVTNGALRPKELALHFEVDRETVYRWMSAGDIPEEFILHKGKRKVKFKREVIAYLEQRFKKLH
jgi:predicted DNA-binding transcriptional regulator AlpA